MAVGQVNVVQKVFAEVDLIQDRDHIFVIRQLLSKSLTKNSQKLFWLFLVMLNVY
ncbi:hypothetical protein M876_03510 [Elizabethkingia anophelis FMS-007]|nr:hypothetical protein M876_03510 [Elizabethkingia anophelis FMS-007]